MLLTVTLTRAPATDLGYLLHKHPARCQTFELSFGLARVFYPEATDARCTAALLLDVDPIDLARPKPGRPRGRQLTDYVNDRPYAASSFTSVAMSKVFRTAMAGRCAERPDVVEEHLPLEARLSAVRGSPELVERLFAPLGYDVTTEQLASDNHFPDWGPSPYVSMTLTGVVRLRDLLAHLYVLIPVLDTDKHYWIGTDEVDKLLRHGEGWLTDHPERDLIAHRYLRRRRSLARLAIDQLTEADPDDLDEDAPEDEPRLHDQRLDAVVAALRACGAQRVVDLGCGAGKLVQRLLVDRAFTEIVGMDVSHRALEIASDRLQLDRYPPEIRDRVRLLHGSLTYRDRRLEGYDAAAVVEVIEHLDPRRLAAFERVLFECCRPGTVVLTTPNREYNVRFEGLEPGGLRHGDHRFEWTRDEFRSWSEAVERRFGYSAHLTGIGPDDAEVGTPSQMAVFTHGGAP